MDSYPASMFRPWIIPGGTMGGFFIAYTTGRVVAEFDEVGWKLLVAFVGAVLFGFVIGLLLAAVRRGLA